MYKKCVRCKEIKPIKEFHHNKTQKDRFHYYCKKCTIEENKKKKYQHRYGITLEEKIAMVHAQHGKCAICRKELNGFSNSCVDHNHKTNAVRGILCQECNKGLGSFYDNPDLLRKAASYLDSWNL